MLPAHGHTFLADSCACMRHASVCDASHRSAPRLGATPGKYIPCAAAQRFRPVLTTPTFALAAATALRKSCPASKVPVRRTRQLTWIGLSTVCPGLREGGTALDGERVAVASRAMATLALLLLLLLLPVCVPKLLRLTCYVQLFGARPVLHHYRAPCVCGFGCGFGSAFAQGERSG